MEIEKLELGQEYSKKDLAELLQVPQLAGVREGIYNLQGTDYVLFFVTLDKEGADENLHYNDFFEGDIFHWDSQNSQHINSPFIKNIVEGTKMPLLFARVTKKEKSKALAFVYCGRLEYENYITSSARPVHLMFKSLDFDSQTTAKALQNIYLWKPGTSASKGSAVSTTGKKIWSRVKPTKTERKGLVTSRVGQGYYRQLVIGKWKGKCAVTSCDLQEILIASHIVPWRDSTEEERLDPDNGILLSPVIDALFDKHLISFDPEGFIMVSDKLTQFQRSTLNIEPGLKLKVDEGMKNYLDRHRKEFQERQERK